METETRTRRMTLRTPHVSRLMISTTIVLGVLLTGCGSAQPSGAIAAPVNVPTTPTQAATSEGSPSRVGQISTQSPPSAMLVATQAPSQEPTSIGPLGGAPTPLILAMPPGIFAEQAALSQLSEALSANSGLSIETIQATSYRDMVDGLCSGEVHAAVLTAPVMIAAQARGCAEPLAVAVQRGSTFDVGQIIARIDTGVASLEDLLGRTFCRPDAASPTGWVFPALLMRMAGVDPDHDFAAILDTGSDPEVVRRVVARECDAGGTYADARQALTGEIVGLMEWTAVIARTEPIPHDTLAVSSQLSTEFQSGLLDGFLKLDAASEGGDIMASNQWERFAPADESQFTALLTSMQAAGVDFDTYITP